MAIVEPADNAYEKEWRLKFDAKDPSGPHVVVSGNVNIAQLANGTSDEHFEEYLVHLVVGPYWKSVNQVVPLVTVSGFENTNADEDDEEAWWITDLTWDAQSGPPGPNVDEERIRLKFKISVKGENSHVLGVAYQLTARGRELGHQGLNSPPNVWTQP
jgi:hypothetical protein